MVILRGVVRSGTASTDDADSYIANAAIIQESSAVYTSTNGTFYTSALNLDVATCQATEYASVSYSIPDFATTYDPAGVISGSITQDANTSTSGVTIMTDTSKIFLSGSLTSRTLSMRSGVYDGFSGIITQNTQNTFRMGGAYVTSGGGTADGITLICGLDGDGVVRKDVFNSVDDGATWTCLTSNVEFDVRYALESVSYSGKIIITGGATGGGNVNDVWKSVDNGATWSCNTSNSSWEKRSSHGMVLLSDGSIVLLGGRDYPTFLNDVWRSTDDGATWTCMTSNASWTARFGMCVEALSGDNILLIGGWVSGSITKDDAWVSDDYGATWSQRSVACTGSGRSFFTSVVISGDVVVIAGGRIGGIGGSPSNDVWKSEDGGSTWTQQTASAEWSKRYSHCMTSLPDNSLILAGGYDSSVDFEDVWKSTDAGATWTCMTSAALFGKREDFGFVYSPVASSTSAFVVIAASSGDIYNIGGISGESTTNIIFTLWDNKGYGRGKTR